MQLSDAGSLSLTQGYPKSRSSSRVVHTTALPRASPPVQSASTSVARSTRSNTNSDSSSVVMETRAPPSCSQNVLALACDFLEEKTRYIEERNCLYMEASNDVDVLVDDEDDVLVDVAVVVVMSELDVVEVDVEEMVLEVDVMVLVLVDVSVEVLELVMVKLDDVDVELDDDVAGGL